MNKRKRVLLRTVPFLILGVLAFFLYLALFVDIPGTLKVIQNASLPIYFFALLALILSNSFFALAWQQLLRHLSINISFKKAALYVWASIFADLLIPAESVSGEITRAYLMSKEPNNDPGKVVASLVTQRMLSIIITTVTLFICFFGLLMIGYPLASFPLQIVASITIVSGVGFAFLMVILMKEKWTERLIMVMMDFLVRISKGRFKLENFRNKVIDSLRNFHESLRVFGSKPIKLLPAILFSCLSWLSRIGTILLVFISIGYLKPDILTLLLKITAVYTLVIAVKSIPIGIPAEAGIPEIMMTTLFALFGITQERDGIAAAATILIRLLTMWFSFFIGFAVVQWLGVKSLIESGIFEKKKN